jgi:hypothetical protein
VAFPSGGLGARGAARAYGTMSLATGLGLIVAIFARVSLAAVLAGLGGFCLLVGLWVRAQTSPAVRRELAARARTGALAGLVATLGYDAVRLGVVALFALRVRPLEALPHFGALLLGTGASPRAMLVAGTAFHYANGVLFGAAYALVVGARRWWYGILWGLALELLMMLVYPRWLSLAKVIGEFTVVSLIGHLVYGTILGTAVSRSRRRAPW